MARIRTIKPEFFTSEQVMECSTTARLLFVGMWCFCDDAGIHPASLKTVKAEVFPSDDITVADIKKMVDELIANGLLIEYESSGKAYWMVTGWHHQRIEKPTFKHPLPTEKQQKSTTIPKPLNDNSTTIRRLLDDHSTPEWKGEEGNGMEVNQYSVGESIPRNLETTPAERICARLRNVGVRYVNPSHPKLLALIQAGISEGELADLASEPASRGKGFAWILAAAEGRRKDASTVIPSLTVVPAAEKPPEVCAHCGAIASKRIGLLWFCTDHDQYSVQEVG